MKFITSTIFVLVFLTIGFGQVVSTSADGRSDSGKYAVVESGETHITNTIKDAGRYFKQGLLNVIDARRAGSGEQFNKSIEVFLTSGINLSSEDGARARDCYNQLIETIYRIEFPTDAQLPQIRGLSTTCGWNIENQLADDVSRVVRPAEVKQFNGLKRKIVISSGGVFEPSESTPDSYGVGFNDQKFIPSSLDELAKLGLSDIELKTAKKSPSVKMLYQTIGPRPAQLKDGKVQPVMKYFNDTFNDPYSMRFVSWSPVTLTYYGISPYWAVSVKYRAKNLYGAYVLTESTYYLRNGKVISPIKDSPAVVSNELSKSSPSISEHQPKIKITRVVKAQAGDNVRSVAERYQVSAIELAQVNGLLPTSILGAGRELRLPDSYHDSRPAPKPRVTIVRVPAKTGLKVTTH